MSGAGRHATRRPICIRVSLFCVEWIWPLIAASRYRVWPATVWRGAECPGKLFQAFRSLDFEDFSKAFYPWLFDTWCLAEVLFFIYFWLQRCRFQRLPKSSTENSGKAREQRQRVVQLILGSTNDAHAMLSGWFRAPFESIHRGNFEEWLASTLFYRDVNNLTASERAQLDDYIDEAAQRWGVTFPAGYNSALRGSCMRPNLDPVAARFRPLFIYACVALGRFLSERSLLSAGYRRWSVNGMNYWVRSPSEMASLCLKEEGKIARPPPAIVLLHGIGVGAGNWASLAKVFADNYGRESFIFIPETTPYVCYRVFPPPPLSSAETSSAIAAMLRQHEYPNFPKATITATFVGQSLGTCTLSFILRNEPQIVEAVLLLDPVCLMLHMPHVCYNFLYQTPHSPSTEALRFGASDLYICAFMHRHFFWQENAMWLDEVPSHLLENRRFVVVLAERDDIVDVHLVRDYLLGLNSELKQRLRGGCERIRGEGIRHRQKLRDCDVILMKDSMHTQWMSNPDFVMRALNSFHRIHCRRRPATESLHRLRSNLQQLMTILGNRCYAPFLELRWASVSEDTSSSRKRVLENRGILDSSNATRVYSPCWGLEVQQDVFDGSRIVCLARADVQPGDVVEICPMLRVDMQGGQHDVLLPLLIAGEWLPLGYSCLYRCSSEASNLQPIMKGDRELSWVASSHVSFGEELLVPQLWQETLRQLQLDGSESSSQRGDGKIMPCPALTEGQHYKILTETLCAGGHVRCVRCSDSVRQAHGQTWSVISDREYEQGSIVDVCPALLLQGTECDLDRRCIWRCAEQNVVGLGLAALYHRSAKPKLEWFYDPVFELLVFCAAQRIHVGDELSITWGAKKSTTV